MYYIPVKYRYNIVHGATAGDPQNQIELVADKCSRINTIAYDYYARRLK